MLGVYLRHTFMVSCALLAIALTLDIWPQVQLVTSGQYQGVFIDVWRVGRFCALRTPDLFSPLIPFAVFLGVVWSEITHTQSGERMLIWNSGRSVVQCLAPAMALAILVGLFQFALDAYLGPSAMAVQMQEKLGRNGVRLDRTRDSGSHWIVSQDGLVRTEIAYGPPPTLRNLTIYKLDAEGRLTEVEAAQAARPIPGTSKWRLENGHFWLSTAPRTDQPRTTVTFGETTAGEQLIPFTSRVTSLKLDPLWLSKIGIEVQYLPLPDLKRLAGAQIDPLARARFGTRIQEIFADLVFPGAMTILAALLSIRAFAYRTPPRALIGVLLAGYLAHFANKAFLLMGHHGYIGASFAAWTVPVAVIAVILASLRFGGKRGRPQIETA
jgi:lipopolysaccharide export system permease protein